MTALKKKKKKEIETKTVENKENTKPIKTVVRKMAVKKSPAKAKTVKKTVKKTKAAEPAVKKTIKTIKRTRKPVKTVKTEKKSIEKKAAAVKNFKKEEDDKLAGDLDLMALEVRKEKEEETRKKEIVEKTDAAVIVDRKEELSPKESVSKEIERSEETTNITSGRDKIRVVRADSKDELVLKGNGTRDLINAAVNKQAGASEAEAKEFLKHSSEEDVFVAGKERSIGLYKKIAFSFIILTVLLVAAVFYFSFIKVTITLIPNQERIGNNLIFDVYDIEKNDNSGNLIGNGIKGIVRQVEIEDSAVFGAGGSEVIGKEVVGKVKILNNYNKNQPLVATTRLLSPHGKLYRIKETVNIPAGESAEVEVYADDPDPEMAIGPNRFSIPGLWAGLQDKIYAESESDFIYRQRIKKYIEEADIDNGINELKQKLLNSAKSKINEKYKDYDQVIYKIDEDSIQSNMDGRVGEEKDEFNISISAQVVVVAFNDEMAVKLAKQKFISSLPDNKELISFDSGNIIYALNNYDYKEGIATVNATFEGKISLKENSSIIDVEKILGLNKDQLEVYLSDMPEIAGFDIKFYPSFIKKVPKLVDRIKIDVKK